MMNADRSQSPHRDEGEDDEDPTVRSGAGLGTISAAQQRVQGDNLPRTRSPTPPRALYRSTTGKGVAFTVDDIAFLIRFMEYRKFVTSIYLLHQNETEFFKVTGAT